MSTQSDLVRLVDEIEELIHRYGVEYQFDTGSERRKPATTADIHAVEDFFKVTLPGDYKSFLSYCNGWKNFFEEYTLLSTSEMLSQNSQAKVAEMKSIWYEDPIVRDGLFVYLGNGRCFGFFDYKHDPPRLRFYDIGEYASYDRFTDYLVDVKNGLKKQIAGE